MRASVPITLLVHIPSIYQLYTEYSSSALTQRQLLTTRASSNFSQYGQGSPEYDREKPSGTSGSTTISWATIPPLRTCYLDSDQPIYHKILWQNDGPSSNRLFEPPSSKVLGTLVDISKFPNRYRRRHAGSRRQFFFFFVVPRSTLLLLPVRFFDSACRRLTYASTVSLK